MCVGGSIEFGSKLKVEPFAKLQDYLLAVAHPMSLRVVMERLEKNYYRSNVALTHDIQLVASNCTAYNEPDAPISRVAVRLAHMLGAFVDDKAAVLPVLTQSDDEDERM